MNSLKTQEIDGIQIIIGLQKRVVDPVATRKKAIDLIAGLPEILELKAQAEKRAGLTQLGRLEETKALSFRAVKNVRQADIHSNKCRNFLGAADLCNDVMKEINSRLAPKQKEILENSTVYFEPRDGEVVLLEAEIDSLMNKFLSKLSNQQVKVDGSIVDDFRGVSYNKKTSGVWGRITIGKLGVKIPTDGKLDSDLTDADKTEIESGRIAGLSDEDRVIEEAERTQSVLKESIKMRYGLEITGDPVEALKLSQDYYMAELAKIKSRYK